MARRGALKLLLPLGLAVFSLASLTWLSPSRRRRGSAYDQLPVFRLRNSAGARVTISPVGAAILRLEVPDAKGRRADVVLGYQHVDDYITKEPVTYFGAIVGRVANRIAGARFLLGAKQYTLLANNGPNALHGGTLGLHRRVWQGAQFSTQEHVGVVLHYDSPAGEEGYPGTLRITVTYRLARARNDLECEIQAVTDEATPVNIVQHSYFNMAGHSSGHTILDHIVHLPNADHYTPLGAHQIPTGEIAPVMGTALDFTSPRPLGENIGQLPGGYDHNFVLFNQGPQARFITKNGLASHRPKLAATVVDPKSGRCLEVLTTAPGLQLYSGNFLDPPVAGKGGAVYAKHTGMCLETQGFPNAINQPAFPSPVLQPSDTYKHVVIFRFSAQAPRA